MAALALAWSIGAAAAADESARILEHNGQWELAYGLVYYRVFGKVTNASKEPLKYVKLEIELLDKDGKPVLSRVAYNQKAEGLAEEETEGYVQTKSFEERLAETPPLGAGEEDLFRVGIAKDDIPKNPKFRTYRVRIVEAQKK